MKHCITSRHLRSYGASLLLCLAATTLSAQSPDNSFGTAGIVTTPGTTEILATAQQADGKIVAAGYKAGNMSNTFQVARYLASGALDTAFGTAGLVHTNIAFSAEAVAVIIQPDGKILVGGNYTSGDFAPFYHPVMVRYNSNGTPDNSFGLNGVAMDEDGLSENMAAMALLPDGRILIGGEHYDGSTRRFMLKRYKGGGSPDPTFGTDGLQLTTVGAGAGITGMALLADGSIVAAGTEGPQIGIPENMNSLQFALAKYNNNGSLFTAFGANGIVLTDIAPNASDMINALAMQADGRIVVGGSSGNKQCIARYMPNGTLDVSFGNAGKTITEERPAVADLKISSNGKILSCGTLLTPDFGADFVTMQYKSDGTVDNGFGTNGSLVTNLTPSMPEGSSIDNARYLTLQADGKLLVAGGAAGKFGLVRYTAGTTTGIEHRSDVSAGISVFPNPFHGPVSLSCKDNYPGTDLQLMSISGSKVWQSKSNLRKGNNAIALPEVPQGAYLLVLQPASGPASVLKLIKK